MISFLKTRANQRARLDEDLDDTLRAHIASTTAEGSPFLAGLVNGDSNDPPSSPSHWPVVPYIPGSSLLSSPPRRLDSQLEQIWGLKMGQKDRVVGLSKEDALEKAVAEVLTNTDRRGKRKITFTEVAREFGVDAETLRQRLFGRESKAESAIGRRLLTPGEEDVVIAYIEHLYKMSISSIKRMASDLANEIVTRRIARKSNRPR
jgi:transposase-like protein